MRTIQQSIIFKASAHEVYEALMEEIAFCLSTTGKSKCIKVEKGCLCPGCPVHEKMGFKNVYYCIRGNENDQLARK